MLSRLTEQWAYGRPEELCESMPVANIWTHMAMTVFVVWGVWSKRMLLSQLLALGFECPTFSRTWDRFMNFVLYIIIVLAFIGAICRSASAWVWMSFSADYVDVRNWIKIEMKRFSPASTEYLHLIRSRRRWKMNAPKNIRLIYAEHENRI